MTVEKLDVENARALVPGFLSLIVSAYPSVLEGAGRPLPAGLFALQYDNAVALDRFRQTVVPSVFQRGGGYSVIRRNGAVLASLKTLPGSAVEDRFSGMLAIAEILTDPVWQRRGLGAALLHAELKQHEAPQARLVLDSFIGSPINSWYQRLGFVAEQPSGALALPFGYALPTEYMVTPAGLTANSLAAQLEESYPALRLYEPLS